MEAMRFWGIDPDSWNSKSHRAQTIMIAHFREHAIRESHTHKKQTDVAERHAKKKKK